MTTLRDMLKEDKTNLESADVSAFIKKADAYKGGFIGESADQIPLAMLCSATINAVFAGVLAGEVGREFANETLAQLFAVIYKAGWMDCDEDRASKA